MISPSSNFEVSTWLGKSPNDQLFLDSWCKSCRRRKRVIMSFRRLRLHKCIQFSVPRARGPLILQRQKGWVGRMWLLGASMAVGKGDQLDWWKGLQQDAWNRNGPGRKAPGEEVRLDVGLPESWLAVRQSRKCKSWRQRSGSESAYWSLWKMTWWRQASYSINALSSLVKWDNLYITGLLWRWHDIIYVKMPCQL